MIRFGTFTFTNMILERYEASRFNHSKFAKGQTSYNLYVRNPEAKEEEDFFIICNSLKGFDMVKAERYKKRISITGTILKNPVSHKILYVINEEGSITFEGQEEDNAE